jgi:hypothetical protein
MIISGLCLDSSDIAIKICLIAAVYLALYTFRREIMKGICKAARYYADAAKETLGVKK